MLRQDFVRLVGGGLVAAPLAACAPGADLDAAWRSPGVGEGDPRRKAVAWGILAPNPHNMQPWLLDLRTPGEAMVHVDPARLLPQTDPFNRQIVVGTGAFLELLRMAAARDGWAVEITPFPEGEPASTLDARPLAHLRFTRAAPTSDPLFGAVLQRRTNRAAFTAQPVAASAAEAVVRAAARPGVAAEASVEPARVAKLRALAFRGAYVEAHTPAAHIESTGRTFLGDADIAAHPYGVSVRGPMIEAAHALGLLTRRDMETPGTFAYDQTVQFLKTDADTAQGFIWLTTPGAARTDELAAGAAYLRANLQATALGLSMQPFSQGLQEYPAMADMLRTLHAELAPQGGRVQMFARIGYGPVAPPSPKRGVDAQIWRG